MELTITDTHLNTSTLAPENILIAENMIAEMQVMFLSIAVMLIVYLLMFYSLYKINKKLWEKHAWLSFIPLAQYYSFASAAGKSLLYYIILPFISYIISFVLMISFIFTSSTWTLISWGLMLLSYIYMIIMWIRLNHWISKRCGRGGWTTLWLVVIPFIMLPIVAYKLKYNTWSETLSKEKQETVEL